MIIILRTFNKEYSANGCLLRIIESMAGYQPSHVIIYGHNMRNGAMFGKLKSYQNYSFWNSAGNNVFYIYTSNVIKEYKIFSCYISEAISDTYTFNFPTLTSMRDYAANMKAKSMYDTGVDVSNAFTGYNTLNLYQRWRTEIYCTWNVYWRSLIRIEIYNNHYINNYSLFFKYFCKKNFALLSVMSYFIYRQRLDSCH